MRKAILALEDGAVFRGRAFGGGGERDGEVVFNTSMTGYQEVLTDPSYKGQIVAMTYPLIGNYGINEEDVESRKIHLEGFIVKELSRIYSNWRGQMSLDEYLKRHRIVGIEGIDTRKLTRHIRLQGAMKAVISSVDLDGRRLVKKAKDSPGLIGRDLIKEVTCKKPYILNASRKAITGRRFKVVALDCGIKLNILRMLNRAGCSATIVPSNTTALEILGHNPDGILLSNGPGDPAAVSYIVETVRGLIGRKPIFGICLGHQMLGLALGGRTYKLKFGHHGGNQPVKDLRTGKIDITTQNHGFCVDIDTLNKRDIELTHINLNDNTPEGMRHKKLPVFSVQYHPESSPGPHDAGHLFGEFVNLMRKYGGSHKK